jgi:hypothetical protein
LYTLTLENLSLQKIQFKNTGHGDIKLRRFAFLCLNPLSDFVIFEPHAIAVVYNIVGAAKFERLSRKQQSIYTTSIQKETCPDLFILTGA